VRKFIKIRGRRVKPFASRRPHFTMEEAGGESFGKGEDFK